MLETFRCQSLLTFSCTCTWKYPNGAQMLVATIIGCFATSLVFRFVASGSILAACECLSEGRSFSRRSVRRRDHMQSPTAPRTARTPSIAPMSATSMPAGGAEGLAGAGGDDSETTRALTCGGAVMVTP